ncbi:MAG TPA: alpha-isopropylmalate synthase regulatory domain-containing protein, partial [Chthoniobacteraceae bacterium]
QRAGSEQRLTGKGNGPIAAFVRALAAADGGPKIEIANFKQHALGAGTEASAIAYVQIKLPEGQQKWGAGVDTNIELASIKAVLSAVNRASRHEES